MAVLERRLLAIRQDATSLRFGAGICRVASAEITEPKAVKLAAAVASAKTVAAVVSLTRADRRHAATVEQWDPEPWEFSTP
jgi:putative DNA primase/helicase